MIIKQKCHFLILLIISIELFSGEFLFCKSEEIKNIFEREKEIDYQDNYDPKKLKKYTIHSEISKIYKNITEIYISLIDTRLKNKISLGEDFKESYYTMYENLLAPPQKFFPLSDFDKLNATETEIISTNHSLIFFTKNKSEILIHTVYDRSDKDASSKFLFLRNAFLNKFDFNLNDNHNCFEHHLKKLTSEIIFYDSNIVIVDENYFKNCLRINDQTQWFFHEKENGGAIIYVKREINFLDESHNRLLYDLFTKENKIISTKIFRKRILNAALNELMNKRVRINKYIIF